MEPDQGLSGPSLRVLSKSEPHTFTVPGKRINEGEDMSLFLVSQAYRDVLALLMRLNHSMFPLILDGSNSGAKKYMTFDVNDSTRKFTPVIVQLQELLHVLDGMNDEVELDTGPRRFGNVSFRRWYDLLESRASALLKEKLPESVTSFTHGTSVEPVEELRAYLVGSFGSSQRLDYGTGHELNFLAFLGCILKLGGFGSSPSDNDLRDIVLGVVHPYLMLVRKLILRYTLEPAGSHGVWGLDDHFFLPYVFGSAQYGPAIRPEDPVPVEGSLDGATDPGNVVKARIVERERHRNLYFGAIGFIYDVKKGPFWEHSPTLYDISGVRAGWGKINKGMLKMYDAEVLGKFPVVQHFPFGSLYRFDRDPDAKTPSATIHTASQPSRHGVPPSSNASKLPPDASMKAPWAKAPPIAEGGIDETQAPWPTRSAKSGPSPGVERHISAQSDLPVPPIARPGTGQVASGSMPPPTKAPWAR